MKQITVSEEWYKNVLQVLDGRHGCPFCGSTKPPVTAHENDTTFYPRKGCADCGKWWSKPELK